MRLGWYRNEKWGVSHSQLNNREHRMDCQEIRNRLDAWVDGELSAQAAERIAYHLNVCPTCRHSAEELRQMVAALDPLPPMTASATLSRRTLRSFRAGIERPGMVEWWRDLSLAMRSAVCGAALAGLLCGAVLGTSLFTLTPDGSASPYQTLYASEGFYQ
jgi:anti-sigma factor RsiW